MTTAADRRIKVRRSLMDKNDVRPWWWLQCEACGQHVGIDIPRGLTGIAAANSAVADHRRRHRVYGDDLKWW